MKEYKIKKKEFDKEEIEFMQVFFDNGDFLPISGKEIVDMTIKVYDRLILENNVFSPVVHSGFIKFKIAEIYKGFYNTFFLYNKYEYKLNRKHYIEDRFCKEGGIKCITFFDENNWQNCIYGLTRAYMEDGLLILQFLPNPIDAPYESETHTVRLNDIKKSEIESIDLDFENCESFYIYDSEIINMQLNLKDELSWGSCDYIRELESGYIRVKLDKDITWRKAHLLEDIYKNKDKAIKQFTDRLLYDGKDSEHIICHLYINYKYAGFSNNRCECVEIDDVRDPKIVDALLEEEDRTGEECYYFVGGYCEQQPDGSILIRFGKAARHFVKD